MFRTLNQLKLTTVQYLCCSELMFTESKKFVNVEKSVNNDFKIKFCKNTSSSFSFSKFMDIIRKYLQTQGYFLHTTTEVSLPNYSMVIFKRKFNKQ